MAKLDQNRITEDMVKAQRGEGGSKSLNPNYRESLVKKSDAAPKDVREEYKFTGKGGNEFRVGDAYSGSAVNNTVNGDKLTIEQGNLGGRKDAKVNIGGGNTSEGTSQSKAEVNNVNTGYYQGHAKVKTDRISEVTNQTVQGQYEQTEAKQGYNQINKWVELSGAGGITKGTSNADLQRVLYSRNLNDTVKTYVGEKYAVGKVHGGNVLSDYNNNVRIVEDALRNNFAINGKNLNLREIDMSLAKGHVGGMAHLGQKVELTKESRELLKELQFLRRQEGRVKQLQKSHGGLKDTSKAWVKEMYGDSDTATGYDFAKKVGKIGSAGLSVGKTGVVGTIKGVGGIAYDAKRVGLGAQSVVNKAKLKDLEKKGASAKSIEELKDKGIKITEKTKELRVKKMNYKASVDRYASPISTAKFNIKTRYNAFINKRLPWLRPLQDKLKNNIVSRVVRSPFSLLNFLKRAAVKVAIVIGGILLILVLIWVIAMCIVGMTGDRGTGFDSETETIADSAAQKMIDYLYSWQEAYTENVFECSVDTEQGRIWAAKRLPESWFDQIRASDPTLMADENVASVYYDGDIAGFNFGKYWGQRAWKWGGGEDAVGAKPVYETSISDTWEIGGEDGYTDYETHTVHLKFYGNAGLVGDIGDYDMPSVRDCYNAGIDELEFNINGNSENPGTWSEAYEAWEDPSYLNPDVECTFTYLGSRYSYAVTNEKYTQFYDTNGELQKYGIDQFYKAFLIFAMGFQNNDGSDATFSTLYTKEVFDDIMDHATVTLTYEYLKEDKSNSMKANMHIDGNEIPLYTNDYYRCKVHVDVFLEDTGLVDMMYRDATLEVEELDGTNWVHNGEVGNEWAHSSHPFYNIESRLLDEIVTVESEYVYITKDRSDNGYRAWYTESQGENTLPLWGMTEYENADRSMLRERAYDADGLPRMYSEVMDNCIAYFDLDPEDLDVLFGELSFPSGWAATLTQTQILRIMNNMQKWYEEQGLDMSQFASLEEYMQFILSTIGRYGYIYGMHNTGDWAAYNGRGFDCSGYISYLLQAMGKIPNGAYYSCGAMVSGSMGYPVTSYSGNPSSLVPGDLVVKNASWGTAEGSSNHVVMYVGKLQLEGDSEPVDYFVECTTSGKSKGTQLTKGTSTRIAGYDYVVHTG